MDFSGSVPELLDLQSDVVARHQLVEAGLAETDIRRLLRRHDLVRALPGVYVAHTGPLTWQQRAWAAVLWAGPAALCGVSARRAADGPGRVDVDRQPIHVAIAHARRLAPRPGIVVHRARGLQEQVLWNAAPPRQRVEEAVLDLALAADDRLDSVSHIADLLGARLSRADRLAEALERRPRVPDRRFLEAVIADAEAGTCSVLEHGYLTLVEQAHRLPAAARQVRDSRKGPLYRDVCYEEMATIVELDGRLHHSRTRDRDRDMERDLDAAVDGSVTARLGWGQVYGRPCSTAQKVGALLIARGWTAQPAPCRFCVQSPSSGSLAVTW
ncbi:MAG: type IV toxin-antitoxin system AbiEi family antitoxin domain-containing protein [Nocardioidaceae bacterium]|nr:type IV toxin-antitoxin system AbiEi family antitoxin domain-containing protein [Nocardioidaceae bacterium]MCL2613579.1 type IV toxin-antitoxin system AbiEi family antitoxin domain-containing protein [Nocardioidaceae bacterium]